MNTLLDIDEARVLPFSTIVCSLNVVKWKHQAYASVLQLTDRVEQLTTENIKAIHTKLMRSSKVQIVDGGGYTRAVRYVNAGLTRQATQKSAVVRSNQYNLAFCPAEQVDQQLDYICKMGRVCVDVDSSSSCWACLSMHLAIHRTMAESVCDRGMDPRYLYALPSF